METAWVGRILTLKRPMLLAGAGQLRVVSIVAGKVVIFNTNLFVDWAYGDWSQRGGPFH